MPNPWEEIRLDDYEKHMSLDSVRQLQALDSHNGGDRLLADISGVLPPAEWQCTGEIGFSKERMILCIFRKYQIIV